MRLPLTIALPGLLAVAACAPMAAGPQPTGPAVTGSAAGERDETLQATLSGTRLDLEAADGEAPPMVMRLRADGTSETAMAGLVLTGRWQITGDRLCQTDIRLGGVPSDDTAPQCATVSVSGDRVTLVGETGDGGTRRFGGTITPL
jgi:hypothetical protein